MCCMILLWLHKIQKAFYRLAKILVDSSDHNVMVKENHEKKKGFTDSYN